MMPDVVLLQRPAFKRAYKRLHANQREVVNVSIRAIVSDPQLGEQKCGDLADVWVYKFDCVNQQYLMAYLWDEHSRTLLSLGTHENFLSRSQALSTVDTVIPVKHVRAE